MGHIKKTILLFGAVLLTAITGCEDKVVKEEPKQTVDSAAQASADLSIIKAKLPLNKYKDWGK